MQVTAQGFLIFQLTHSPAYLGYVGFASGVPIWLFSLFGGVVSDRVSRRSMLLITQTAMMLLAFILAALTFLGLVQPWQIVVLAFALGVANAFDAPARQAFVVELVGTRGSRQRHRAQLHHGQPGDRDRAGAGRCHLRVVRPGWCFTINGISFLAVIIALLMMRLKPQPRRVRKTSTVVDLKEGLRYVVSHPIIRVLIATAAVSTIFGLSFATLFPAWSVTILGGNSATNGFLQSARGLGSLIAALTIASLGRFKFKGKLLTLGTFLFPLSLLIWAAVRWLPLSLLLMVAVGIGSMFVVNMTNILLQSYVTDDLRGRVMSIFTLSFFGMMPVGALLAGALAEATTEPIAVALGALVVLAFAAFLWLRVPQMRRLE